MISLDEFETHLQDALAHLYDPRFTPSVQVLAVIGRDGISDTAVWRDVLRGGIEALCPGPQVPATSRIWRIYTLLDDRYLKNLTQVETGEHLGISTRHLRREQRAAVRVLAEQLWKQRFSADSVSELALDGACSESETVRVADGAAWTDQVQEELSALRQRDGRAEANVGTELQAAVGVTGPLAAKHDVQVTMVAPGAVDLVARIHPSVLRQIGIVTVCKLLPLVEGGCVDVRAEGQGRMVRIQVAAARVSGGEDVQRELLRELVSVAGEGAVSVRPDEEGLTVAVTLPLARRLDVLVIDDNDDLIHVYRRYTMGTLFDIRHAVGEAAVFAAIDASPPDVIVLDVMLPDVDGWELLVALHEYTATRGIPILICSVIREGELALALGAQAYLPKPVRRPEFIAALEAAVTTA